jgi:hypothetical protein
VSSLVFGNNMSSAVFDRMFSKYIPHHFWSAKMWPQTFLNPNSNLVKHQKLNTQNQPSELQCRSEYILVYTKICKVESFKWGQAGDHVYQTDENQNLECIQRQEGTLQQKD